jgi:hypothetical protein
VTLHLVLQNVLQAEFTYLKSKVAGLLVLRHQFSHDPFLAPNVEALNQLILAYAFMFVDLAVISQLSAAVFKVAALELEEIFKLVFEGDADLHELDSLASERADYLLS